MVGRAYIRLLNNIVKSLKPVFDKKPLRQLMIASNVLKKIKNLILMMKTTEYNLSYILGEKRKI